MNELLIFPVVVALVCGLCLWRNARLLRRRRFLHDTPTSKARGVFIGFVELKGTAESAAPVTSFLAAASCVHYSWRVDESWSRLVTETYTDSKGIRRTRTRTESGSTAVASGGETIPFYLKDDTGVILVRPAGAEMETATVFSEKVGRGDALYYAKGPPGSVPDSTHRRHFLETAIPLQTPVFVAGRARERADVVAAEIAANPESEMFLISTRDEEKVLRNLGVKAWIWGGVGLMTAGVPWGLVLWGKAGLLPAIVARFSWLPLSVFAAVWIVLWVWTVFNSLVALRQRVRQGWSLIDVQLQRRHDLIPRIAATVAGLGAHEAAVQTTLAALRAQSQATPPGVSGPDFGGVAGAVRAVVERYPELTAQAGFAALQAQLVETEQRVALARGYYNDIATQLATRLKTIPERWVGALVGMRPEPLLAAADFERAPVRVEFAA